MSNPSPVAPKDFDFMIGDWAVAQLWLFWVAPIVGGLLGAVTYRFIGSEES